MAKLSSYKHHQLCALIALIGCTNGAVARTSHEVSDDAGKSLSEVVITAPEPQFVAPTRRDQIGRIWAPVIINGKGPFRLALDTGASRSGISAGVADTLGLSPDSSRPVLLRGAMGSVAVSTVRVDSFEVGDVIVTPATGAYGFAMASNYNGVPRPPVVFCRDGDARVVVRRESFDDLISRDVR